MEDIFLVKALQQNSCRNCGREKQEPNTVDMCVCGSVGRQCDDTSFPLKVQLLCRNFCLIYHKQHLNAVLRALYQQALKRKISFNHYAKDQSTKGHCWRLESILL